MCTLIFMFISVVATGLSLYIQYMQLDKIIYWSIPIYLIAYFFLAIALSIIIFYLITLLIPTRKNKDKKPHFIYRFIIHFYAKFICEIFGLDITINGIDKIPKDQKYLLVCNHQSNLDPISTIASFYKYKLGYLTFIMKDQILKIPMVNRILKGAGFLALDRKNNRKGAQTIILASKRIEKGLNSIGLYPEGTRSAGPEMIEFRNGAFKVAQKAKCPIVIMIIDNGYRVKRRFPWRRTKILLEVLDVLSYDEIKDLHTNEIGNIVHHKMTEALEMRRKELKWLNE
ncbi:MAG TPA: hypothetical protein GXZ48_02535 [Acholeplasmataceae bacterium]|nr:hypothetical protein [Acholeplasmataceae bacterium]